MHSSAGGGAVMIAEKNQLFFFFFFFFFFSSCSRCALRNYMCIYTQNKRFRWGVKVGWERDRIEDTNMTRMNTTRGDGHH